MNLLRTQPIEAARRESGMALRRELSGYQLILLGIGATIGASVFVLTGTAAAQHAGPAIVLSFIISAASCLCTGLCYSEFASMIPVAGSAYTYAYVTIGELVAWIIGWDLIVEYLFGSATLAVGWSGYVVRFLSDFWINFPPLLCTAPFKFEDGHWLLTGALLNLPALFILLLASGILIIGIRESAAFNAFIVIIKVGVIVIFIGLCVPHVHAANWTPFIPESFGKPGVFGWTGVFAGAGVIFFAYIGFDALSTAAQEAKNPQQNMPIGIIGSVLVCTVLYVLLSLVLTGVVSYKELNVSTPISLAIERIGPSVAWIKPWIEVGAICGLSSVILVALMAQSRIFYRMAIDGLLPRVFASVHSRFRTPHLATVITGLCAALLATLMPIDVLAELVSIATLLAFTIVCVGVIVLRRTRPDLERKFRTPCVPFVPLLGAVICISQMVFQPVEIWICLVIWLLIGIAIYFGYGCNRSRLNRDESL
jgi:basic amino acid/polyamine antiporter, APA family